MYVVDCLNSLRTQWKSLNQIIVVIDDDDKSLRKVQRFVEDHGSEFANFTVAKTLNHSGVYSAINVGLKYNRCDMVSFCGADDMWDPARSGHMIRNCSDWRSISNSFHCKIDEHGRRIKRSIEPLGGVYSYTRAMLDKLGMFRQWPTSADSDMFYRAKKMGGHLNVYRSYSYLYRQHGSQLTHDPETAIGSEKRRFYENMWHDGVLFHEEPLCDHVLVVND